MLESNALPFVQQRLHQDYSGPDYTTTSETVHGIIRLDGDVLRLQWRISREINKFNKYGAGHSSDSQQEAIREIEIPLEKLSGARIKRIWYRVPPKEVLLITTSDLQTFSKFTIEDKVPGLASDHPAELVLEIRRSDRKRWHVFCSALRFAISEQMLASMEGEGTNDKHINRGLLTSTDHKSIEGST